MLGRSTTSLVVFLSCSFLGACGGESETSVPDDGKVRPAKNGKAVAELEACEAVKKGVQSKQDSLQCGAATSRPCPDMLRVVYGENCAYDEGTVQGCVEHYGEQKSCDELTQAYEDCILESAACN